MSREPLPFFPPLYLGGPEITTENCEREVIDGSIHKHCGDTYLGIPADTAAASTSR